MSLTVNVTLHCDSPGCRQILPSNLPFWSWPNGPSSAVVNERMAEFGWGPPIVAGTASWVGETHIYCQYHNPERT